MNALQNMLSTYSMLTQNPMQVLSRRFNIPQTVDVGNPDAIIQHLVDTNQIKQSDLDAIRQIMPK